MLEQDQTMSLTEGLMRCRDRFVDLHLLSRTSVFLFSFPELMARSMLVWAILHLTVKARDHKSTNNKNSECKLTAN